MILLILVVLWIVVLAPGLIKRHFENRSTESIESFHERLHLLERTGPKLVAPAYRLQTAQASTAPTPGASGYPAISSMPGRPNLVLLEPVDECGGDVVEDRAGAHYQRIPQVFSPQPDTNRRLQVEEQRRRHEEVARQRRRDLVLGLVATVVVTGLLGIVGSLHPLWIVTAISVAALVGYVGLVAYAQTLTVDRGRPASLRAGGYSEARSLASAGYPGAWDEGPAAQYADEEYDLEDDERRAATR